MGSNWKICELDKVIKKRNQGVNTTTEKVKYSSEGIIVIRANNILSGRIDYRDCAFVDEETFSRIKDTCKPRKGDVLYTNIGSQFGTAVKVNVDFEFAIAWNVLRIQTSNEVDSDFLVYLLNNPVNKRYIQSLNSSSTMPFVSGKVVGGVAFKFPSIAEQIKIKNVLKPFEHSIELNRQTNQTLEQMAQALFKSWFVDFDPVFDNLLASVDFNLENLETSLPDELKLKAQRRLAALDSLENAAECKASLSALAHELQAQTQAAEQVSEKAAETPVKPDFSANPNILAQHANTHAHFPNEFEHNEQLGWIPKGWSVSNVEGISEKVFSGGTPNTRTSEYWNGELHWFSSGETRSNLILDTEKRITVEGVKNSSTKLSIPGDILIAGAGQGHTRGQTSLNRIHTYFNQSVVCIRVKDGKLSNWLFENLHSRYEEMRALSDSHSVRGSLTTKIVARMQVLLPCDNLIDTFNKNAKAYSIRQEKLLSEISVLTKLRDTLLPKLISGELQIPDVATDEEVID